MSSKNPYKEGGMFEGASPWLFEKAKQLRKNMTHAETLLWMHLRKGINGLKFRRQHPLGLYIADFYCHKCKLIIEVDGSIHDLLEINEYDKVREKDIEAWGYNIIRFSNQQIINSPEKVIESISKKISDLLLLQTQNAPSKDGV